jgi:hypothetical protein
VRKNVVTPESTSLIIAEFSATREEIVKRVELQHQLLSLSLIVFGTILTFGLQTKSASSILLYPFLATFLSIAWASNSSRIREMQLYISIHIESKVGENNIGWEHFRTSIQRPFGSLTVLSSRGIFVGTQLLAGIVGASLANFSEIEKLLFVLVIICIIFTLIVLRPTKKS